MLSDINVDAGMHVGLQQGCRHARRATAGMPACSVTVTLMPACSVTVTLMPACTSGYTTDAGMHVGYTTDAGMHGREPLCAEWCRLTRERATLRRVVPATLVREPLCAEWCWLP